MSLELNGSNEKGTFVCQESWYESKEGELLNCLVYGSYQAEADKIRFYCEDTVDPKQTEKLKTHQQLGIPYFEATLIVLLLICSSTALFHLLYGLFY